MELLNLIILISACYAGGLLVYATSIYIENRMPLKNYFGNENLYNIMFIHIAAKKYERDGIRGDDLVKRLQATKYGFMTAHENRMSDALHKKKTSNGPLSKFRQRKIERQNNELEQAYIFAMRVLNDKVLLEQFIIPDGFGEDTYSRLCQAIEEDQKHKEAYCIIKDILTCQTDENVRKMMPLLALWNTRPFLTDSQDSEQTTAGEYQSYLFRVLKSQDINIINCDQKKYIKAMETLREIYPEMEEIRTDSTLSGYSKKYSEKNPDIRHMKEIIKKYTNSK